MPAAARRSRPSKARSAPAIRTSKGYVWPSPTGPGSCSCCNSAESWPLLRHSWPTFVRVARPRRAGPDLFVGGRGNRFRCWNTDQRMETKMRSLKGSSTNLDLARKCLSLIRDIADRGATSWDPETVGYAPYRSSAKYCWKEPGRRIESSNLFRLARFPTLPRFMPNWNSWTAALNRFVRVIDATEERSKHGEGVSSRRARRGGSRAGQGKKEFDVTH